MSPLLVIVRDDGIVTVIPAGIATVSPRLIVIGGVEPPHVAGSFQSPFCVAVNVEAKLLAYFTSLPNLNSR